MQAWFGDLGDGIQDGSANDPRMALAEVKTNYNTLVGHNNRHSNQQH